MEDVSFDFLKPEIIKLEKEGKVVDKMFNGTDSFYIAEKKGFDTILNSTSGLQIPSMVEISVVKTSHNNTELLLKTGWKAANRNGCFYIICFGAFFHQKTKLHLTGEYLPNTESGSDKKLVQSLLEQIKKGHLKKETDRKIHFCFSKNRQAISNWLSKSSS